MTALDLVTSALAELNVADASTALAADDAVFALARLNEFLDAMALEGLYVHQVTRTTWTLTPSVASYTIGLGAVINVTRPVNPQAIAGIGYVNTGLTPVQETTDLPLLTVADYIALPLKTLTSPRPNEFYYNPTFAPTGFGTIYPFPIPTAPLLQGVIYTQTPASEFAALTDPVVVAPGYRRFLRLNLAVELASGFQVQLPAGLEQRAADAKANLKRANLRLEDMQAFGPGTYDIFSDTYIGGRG